MASVSGRVGVLRSRLAAVLMVCAASVLSGTPALAASVEAETQRLDNLAFYVEQLDQGWDPLIDEFAAAIAELRTRAPDDALRPILERRDGVMWARVENLLATAAESDEDRVLELCRILGTDAVDETRRKQAQQGVASVSTNRGERYRGNGQMEQAFAAYREAVETVPGFERALEGYGALGIELADARVAEHDYTNALSMLDGLKQFLPAGHERAQEAESRRERIYATTSELRVRFLGDATILKNTWPKKDWTDFTAATVHLEPRGDGLGALDVSAATPVRVPRGSYQATLTGQGGDALPVVTGVVVGAGVAEIVVPSVVPKDMVYVEGGAIDGGARIGAFLCDRFEVRNAHYAEFASAQRRSVPIPGDADRPARGINFTDARDFASWAGKRLPSTRQWTYAALGRPGGGQNAYPWGADRPQSGLHFVGAANLREPGPVTACEAGESAFRVRNMFRNVWEWLDNAWYIGGGFSGTDTDFKIPWGQRDAPDWLLRVLHDPRPSKSAYDKFDQAEDRDRYELLVDEAWRTDSLPEIGFRCVFPLE